MTKIKTVVRDRATQVAILAGDGLSSREIGSALGISGARVRYLAKRWGIQLARPGSRRFSFYASDRRARVIRKMAEKAGVSPATMIERMLSTVVDDGEEFTERRLGKLALPATQYAKTREIAA